MSEARTRCMSHNNDETNIRQYQFDLLSVRDEEENKFISKLKKGDQNPYTLPWIGLYKRNTHSWSEPKWTDGSLVLYIKWAPNAPTDYEVCSNMIISARLFIILYNNYPFTRMLKSVPTCPQTAIGSTPGVQVMKGDTRYVQACQVS